MIKGVFPSYIRFGYICIIVGIFICILSLMEFNTYQSIFSKTMTDTKSAEQYLIYPIKEVSIASFICGLAAIVGGIALVLNKNLGRIILIILCWILIIYGVGYGIYFQFAISEISQTMMGIAIYIRIFAILFCLIFIFAVLSLIKHIKRNPLPTKLIE